MSFYSIGSQTVGPYFKLGLEWLYDEDAAGPEAAGERVEIHGRVLDAAQVPVPDAVVEVWQADANGKYHHPEDARDVRPDPAFQGFARVPTDAEGRFVVRTVKPGRVPGPGGTLQAPHLNVIVMMRGLLRHAPTRMYFPDGPGNEEDPVLALVPEQRRATLIPVDKGDGVLEWDICMQGERETVFFEY